MLGDDEPARVGGNTDLGGLATQVVLGAVSSAHSCAIMSGGSVRCWGAGSAGKLGYGNTNAIGDNETVASAGDVPLGGTAVQLALGGGHTCALMSDGKVRCWGSAEAGQLGYGNTNNIGDNEAPASEGFVEVGGTVTQLAAGATHTCALLSGGAIRCWGTGTYGGLGYGNGITQNVGDNETPSIMGDVPLGGVATQVVAGYYHTCALLSGGNVRCWGYPYAGYSYLSTGTYGSAIGDGETPAMVGDVNIGGTATQLAAGNNFTCALMTGGTVRCWGDGAAGKLGQGNKNTIGDDELPASVGPISLGGKAVQISAGDSHVCALLEDGNVRCWGSNASGRLGTGQRNDVGDDELPASAPAVTF